MRGARRNRPAVRDASFASREEADRFLIGRLADQGLGTPAVTDLCILCYIDVLAVTRLADDSFEIHDTLQGHVPELESWLGAYGLSLGMTDEKVKLWLSAFDRP